jgi:hypothetical protein
VARQTATTRDEAHGAGDIGYLRRGDGEDSTATWTALVWLRRRRAAIVACNVSHQLQVGIPWECCSAVDRPCPLALAEFVWRPLEHNLMKCSHIDTTAVAPRRPWMSFRSEKNPESAMLLLQKRHLCSSACCCLRFLQLGVHVKLRQR